MSNTVKAKIDLIKRQLLVGRVRKMLDSGCSVKEVQEELNLPESNVRSLIKTCEEAKKNRDKMNTTSDNTVD